MAKTEVNKNIETRRPDVKGRSVYFDKTLFESIIQNNGYTVIHEKAIKCPCRTKAAGFNPLSSCRNCGGLGWLHINPIRTKMILSNMNLDTKMKDWTEEKLGTASITARDVDPLSFMDKVTVEETFAIHSQVFQIKEKEFAGTKFGYTNYNIIEVLDCFLFIKSDEKLVRLVVDEDFTFERQKFMLTSKHKNLVTTDGNTTISIRFKFNPVFYIIDTTRDVITAISLNINKKEQTLEHFPVHGVGRRAHLMFDFQNFTGDYLFDNSYLNTCEL